VDLQSISACIDAFREVTGGSKYPYGIGKINRSRVGTQQVGKRTRELEGGGGIQSWKDEDEEEMTCDQRRMIRRLNK
jgi:hypothetical protein